MRFVDKLRLRWAQALPTIESRSGDYFLGFAALKQPQIDILPIDLQMGEYRSRSLFTQGSLTLGSFDRLSIDLNRLLE